MNAKELTQDGLMALNAQLEYMGRLDVALRQRAKDMEVHGLTGEISGRECRCHRLIIGFGIQYLDTHRNWRID